MEVMLTLTLDTSCFEAGCKNLDQLMKWCEEERIVLQISEVTETEILRDHPKKLREYVEYFNLLEVLKEDDVEDMTAFNRIAQDALKILTGELTDTRLLSRVVSTPDEWFKYGLKHRNDYIDVDIFALHVLSQADFFVTRDAKGFMKNGRQERYEKQFNTNVRLLDTAFIEEMRGLIENKEKK